MAGYPEKVIFGLDTTFSLWLATLDINTSIEPVLMIEYFKSHRFHRFTQIFFSNNQNEICVICEICGTFE